MKVLFMPESCPILIRAFRKIPFGDANSQATLVVHEFYLYTFYFIKRYLMMPAACFLANLSHNEGELF